MHTPVLSLLIGATLRLPGLGLLVLPSEPEPAWLTNYDLHTAFTITLPPNTQNFSSVIGTVEEISHADQLPHRGLLLDFNPDILLAVGSRLEAIQILADLY